MTKAKQVLMSGAALLATALMPMLATAQTGGAPNGAKEAGQEAAVLGRCTVPRIDFAASDLMFSTTSSTTYAAIPDATVSFFQSAPGCVIVNYSAFAFAANAGAALMFVRPLLDGVTVAVPAETQFAGDDDEDSDGRWARSHAMNFVFPNVPAGPHRIVMQWRTSIAGQTVFMHRRTTLVHHR